MAVALLASARGLVAVLEHDGPLSLGVRGVNRISTIALFSSGTSMMVVALNPSASISLRATPTRICSSFCLMVRSAGDDGPTSWRGNVIAVRSDRDTSFPPSNVSVVHRSLSVG
jgi:hypothetical protein